MSNYINDETIEKIRESADIVDIISEYLPLRKTGANYMGLCPFHNEKTPSFSVNESKQFFHCFGCGEGGDAVSFIMKKENLSFPEAIKFLADKLNIQIEITENENKEKKDQQAIGYEINRQAALFFLNNLGKNKQALNYLYNREISNKIIRRFGLGYAEDSWEALYKHLRSLKYKEEDIVKLGLIGERNTKNGYYDKFRNRIIFPIIDIKSRVIGFGGRVLDDTMPKYLNSQETHVFNKGYNLYGLNLVNKYSDRKKIIIVEGYMDVIALSNRGINYSVASLGTAFTERQAKLLKRFGRQVYICFDTDKAGSTASLKAIDILRRLDIEPKIILLGKHKDPDDFLRANKIEEFEKRMESALNHMDYKIYINKMAYNLEDVEGKITFTREIARSIKELRSPIEKDIYIKKVAEETNISKEAIEKEVYGNTKKTTYSKSLKEKRDIKPISIILPSAGIIAEVDLVKLMIYDKDFYHIISDELKIDEFENNECKEIIKILDKMYLQEEYIDEKDLFLQLDKENHINRDLIEKIKEREVKFSSENISIMIDQLIKTVKTNRLENKRNHIREEIEQFEKLENKNQDQEDRFINLCIELTNLNKELNLIKDEEGR